MRERVRTVIRRSIFRGRTAVVCAPLLLLACSSGDPSPFVSDQGELFWKLELNHHAVVLSTTAPWDTLTLTATPQTASRQPIAGLAIPEYTSFDPKHVVVSPNGILQAVAPLPQGTVVLVTAKLTANGVTHEDTVRVAVWTTSNPPPVLASFSIHPLPPDSAKTAVLANPLMKYAVLQPRVADPSGTPIDNVPVFIRSTDSTIAFVDQDARYQLNNLGIPNLVVGSRPGNVTFYASTTVFGITKADTLSYRIGFPLSPLFNYIKVERVAPNTAGGDSVIVFNPREITVGTGALVTWVTNPPAELSANPFPQPADIVFDDAMVPYVASAQVAVPLFLDPFFFYIFACDLSILVPGLQFECNDSGNISVGAPIGGASRVFTAPGIYEFHSNALGASGRIIVVDER